MFGIEIGVLPEWAKLVAVKEEQVWDNLFY